MFTKEQISLALNDQCPYCGSIELQAGDEIPEFQAINERRDCLVCEKTFWVVYTATDARED